MHPPKREFIPAAGVDWLLPIYDPLLRLLGRDALLRRTLIADADIEPSQHLLDIGCGTGILSVLLKQLEPNANVRGLDPDPKVLGRARARAAHAGVAVEFDRGFADQLPYSDATFDRVFSSLMFHHLTPDQKIATLIGVHRVLRPGGSFHLLDFGEATSGLHGLIAHLFHRGEEIEDHLEGRIPAMIRAGGFADVEEVSRHGTMFGSISYYRARRASDDGPASTPV
ncbi:MAG: class I SAM-dependent methyltransferase [Deltaproteobacteria bacterium]|nr:class I SAM-dependent methyltransferase [Deltaproteobacteria bacterium]MBW2398757.1 class I SAM-dependent methyltransferase [Deltaproteobacteria bacterium]MBW2666717.1 class I SAM-dependent methyltransferase [Deltaproteobacteria bacterium]